MTLTTVLRVLFVTFPCLVLVPAVYAKNPETPLTAEKKSAYPVTAQQGELPEATQKTLSKVIKAIERKPQNNQSQSIVLERGTPHTTPQENQKNTDASGKNFSITFDSPKKIETPDTETLVASAYQAFTLGQMEASIMLYKQLLRINSGNKEAKFGLATAYFQLQQRNQARKLYTEILASAPEDQAALNNFVVLLRQETPEEALEELKKLAQANDKISDIPAQIGMTYARMGNSQEAIKYLRRAVSLAPSNAAYRYNLAIILDKDKQYPEASAIYRQLLIAAQHGVAIPGNPQTLQKRLHFISQH